MAAKQSGNKLDTWATILRHAVVKCELSRYAICQAAGVQQSGLSRFMAGEGISLDTAERIGRVVGVQLVQDSR